MADEKHALYMGISMLSLVVTAGLAVSTLLNQIGVSDARAHDEQLKILRDKTRDIDLEIKATIAESIHLKDRISQLSDDVVKQTGEIRRIIHDGREQADKIARDARNETNHHQTSLGNKASEAKRDLNNFAENLKRDYHDAFENGFSAQRNIALKLFETDLHAAENRVRDSLKSIEDKTRQEALSASETLVRIKSARDDAERFVSSAHLFFDSSQNKVNQAVHDGVNRYVREQHQFMLSLLAATLSRSLRTEGQGDAGLDEYLGTNILVVITHAVGGS